MSLGGGGGGGVSLLASGVLVYGSSCLVGCVILRQKPVKMLHLLSGDLYTSACAWGGVSLLASGVLVYGSSCLVGCVIFRRQPVKMLCMCLGGVLAY